MLPPAAEPLPVAGGFAGGASVDDGAGASIRMRLDDSLACVARNLLDDSAPLPIDSLYLRQQSGHRHSTTTDPSGIERRDKRHACLGLISVYAVSVWGGAFPQSAHSRESEPMTWIVALAEALAKGRRVRRLRLDGAVVRIAALACTCE